MECTPQELINSAKCFACLSPRQLKDVMTSLLCSIAGMASCDPATLMEDAAAFSPLTAHELEVIQTQLLCEILNGGGSGGSSCLLCGDVDPTDAPEDCTCALYYNKVDSTFWYWDTNANQWQLFG